MIPRMISPPTSDESEAAFMARCQRDGGDKATCEQLWTDAQGISPAKSRPAMNARMPIPLRPDPGALREAALTSLVRACVNVARSVHERFAKSAWPDDRACELLTRAPTTPTTLTDTTALQQVALFFVASLIPVSAAAAVIARSLQLNFDRRTAQISVPSLTLPHAAWLSEGAPLPVVAGTSSPGALVDPYKLGVIVPLTGEMIRNTNAEAVVRAVLTENVAQTLDIAMFSANAAVAGVRPAGILNGVVALPASSATSPLDAMVADVAAIATALAPAAGASQPVLVAAPAQAAALTLRTPRDLWPVLPSAALPAGTVIGIVPGGLATVIEPPRIEAGSDPIVQMDDQPSGDVMTGPTISLFQSDQVGLRFIMPATWGLRSPAAVAWITGAAW
jgi:hypothetical protein